jgi:hypothetical protein
MANLGFYTEGSFNVGFRMYDFGNEPTSDIENPTSKDPSV